MSRTLTIWNHTLTIENRISIDMEVRFLFWITVLITVYPILAQQAGVDFSSESKEFAYGKNHEVDGSDVLDSLFHKLSGAFHHAILDSSAFVIAFLTALLSFIHFSIKRCPVTIIVGAALLMSGSMDVFHTFASALLINNILSDIDYGPFTWAVCQAFNAFIMIVGTGLILSLPNNKKQRFKTSHIILLILLSITIAWSIIFYSISLSKLPQTIFPHNVITRPWDLLGLALFIIAGFIIFPIFCKRKPSTISASIWISFIPQVASQAHMAFGSTELYDGHFNIAHFLKIISYSAICTGLLLDYIETHRLELQSRSELEKEKDKTLIIAKDSKIAKVHAELLASELETSNHSLKKLASELKISNHSLEKLAHQDPLTKILNRRGMEQVLERASKIASRNHQELVAILIDLDNFKEINDKFGHSSGDIVLQETANILEASLRPSDYVARIGGDEFLVLVTVTELSESSIVAERARIMIKSVKIESRNEVMELTASIGVSTVCMKTPTLGDLITQSEYALHQSKESGKDSVISTVGKSTVFQNLTSTRKNICEALQNGKELRVVKQAIYALPNENIIGYELLSRGPAGAFENPDDFFRISMENNILTLVDHLCFKACVTVSDDMDENLSCHINLFPATLLALSPSRLLNLLPTDKRNLFCIEISEQQIIGDPSYLKKYIRELKNSGVKIALDDLGFGRSCLESLLYLEPDIVKIDKKRIIGISDSLEKRKELQKLIKITKTMEAEVVAEGIENRKDLHILIDFEIKHGQGYLWGVPT